jgi:hypothetical protein
LSLVTSAKVTNQASHTVLWQKLVCSDAPNCQLPQRQRAARSAIAKPRISAGSVRCKAVLVKTRQRARFTFAMWVSLDTLPRFVLQNLGRDRAVQILGRTFRPEPVLAPHYRSPPWSHRQDPSIRWTIGDNWRKPQSAAKPIALAPALQYTAARPIALGSLP